MAGSWLDWLYGNATPGSGSAPQMSYDALGNPLPGAAPAPIGLPNNPMSGAPMPPQRPGGLNMNGLPVPMPPQRQAGIVPQAPGLGAPQISYDALGNAIPGSLDLPGRGMNVPLPPQRPAGLFASPQPPVVAPARQAPRANLPTPGAVPASGQAPAAPQAPAQPQGPGQGYEWVKTKDEMGQDVWTTRAIEAPAQPAQAGASTPTMFGSTMPNQGMLNNAGQGLRAFFNGMNSGPAQGMGASVGPNGPQIPQATGLAGMLGAQPSMQAQNSTGPTAFLDQLFGFRG